MSGASELKIDIAERFQHLPHAPIVEAVIDVRARAEGSWEEEAVKSQVSAKLPNYSYLDSQRTYETEIKLAPEKPEQVFRDLGCKGVRFRSKDERQICQFNRDGFVFSRLPPYEDWEKLYGEAMRLWQVYSDIARPTQLQRLGLRFPDDPDPEGHGHVETALPSGLRFTLDTEESIRSFDPDWSPPTGGHRMAVAFRCDSPEDVDRLYRELVVAGAQSHKEPWDAFWGQRYAQVKDPDGNVVDLFAPLER